jgi:DNA topoisomerase-1
MLDFARALPRLRRIIRKDLASDELGRRQVLACALRLLDRGFFRIGSEDYAEQNESYGVTTILKSHVSKLKRRRGGGEELLAYKENGKWVDLTSADINEYVKEATGGDFSAKDFRTWNGTMLAAVALSIDAAQLLTA